FIHCQKYPPSLCYLLMTLGPALMLLSVFDRGTPALLKPLVIFGRVPLFYYLLHLPLIHTLAIVVNLARFGRAYGLYGHHPGPNQTALVLPPDRGFDLPIVYLVWICVVVALYPVCRWFAGFKRSHQAAWLSYL